MDDCECIYSEGEPCEIYLNKIRKARKDHNCSECGEKIEIGTEYEYINGRFEGERFQHKTCPDCLSVRDAFFCSSIIGCIWDEIKTHIDEMDGNIKSACIVKLSPKARKKVCDLIEKQWNKENFWKD